jgi:hypothetical protein
MTAEFEVKTNLPTERDYTISFVGGTAAVTKEFGKGVSLSYVSTGLVDLVWSANESRPGINVGLKSFGFRATTVAQVKGYSVALGDYSVSTRTQRLAIWDASNNLVDLTSTQRLCLTVAFVQDDLEP